MGAKVGRGGLVGWEDGGGSDRQLGYAGQIGMMRHNLSRHLTR